MTKQQWKQAEAREFWEKIAPAEHLVQVYDSKEVFLETLTGFVGTGINAGDAVIIIATGKNLALLYDRLISHGININSLISENKFIPLHAEDALESFMRNGMPDHELFIRTIEKLYAKATKGGLNVRAFGEMVALLWEQGNNSATIELEALWNAFCQKHKLTLFCAYSKNVFNENAAQNISGICSCHTHEIDGEKIMNNAVRYRNANKNALA
jgi:hypothetical protein